MCYYFRAYLLTLFRSPVSSLYQHLFICSIYMFMHSFVQHIPHQSLRFHFLSMLIHIILLTLCFTREVNLQFPGCGLTAVSNSLG